MPISHQFGERGEDGYILITVLFLVALVLIGLAVAAPRMAQSIQRDKEIELVHRGEQYKRAIKLYYRKFGAYPTSIDQLLNTNKIRFLRKRYTDPITGKDDWRLIHLGQAKVPPMGFFGQPLAGIPGAANVGTPVNGATGAAAGGTSPFGGPSTSSPFGSVTVNTPEATSYSDGSDSGTMGGDASSHPSVTITGAASAPMTPTSAGVGVAGASSPGSSSIGGASSPLGGVGPIVGVGIPSTKASLLDYKKQTHYNQWEFVYNPIEDQMRQAGMMGAGTGNVSGTNGTSGTTSTSPFGNSNTNSSPFGSSPSPFGSSPGSSTGGTNSPMGSNPQQ
jgi:type II secretory pathway pseudopilin PulG